MIAYENEPETHQTLTIREFKWLLDQNGVDYKYISGILHMADCYLNDKGHHKDWIKPEMQYGKLMSWLEY